MADMEQMDEETLMMLFDPRSPMKGRSPLPYAKEIHKLRCNEIIPTQLQFEENDTIQVDMPNIHE